MPGRGSEAKRRRAVGYRISSLLAVCAPSIVACSFFAPSLNEYASGDSGAGGQGVANNTSGDAGDANVSGGSDNGGSSSTGGAGVIAAGGAEAGAAGEAGWAGMVTVGKTVAASDVKLTPVITRGMPTFAAFTSYGTTEAVAAQTAPPRAAPTYAPYDSGNDAWWDDLVAEQLQARIPVVMFPTHGAFSTTPGDTTGPDTLNPRRLSAWVAALTRAGVTDEFAAACFVDMTSVQAVSNNLHARPAGTAADLSSASDWNNVIWQRTIEPWFDTIPSAYWFTLKQNPDSPDDSALIEIGNIPSAAFTHAAGNLSDLLSYVASKFHDAYNVYPAFVLDSSWLTIEPTLSTNRYVIGQNDLITKAPSSVLFGTYQGLTVGSAVPGFVDPAYYQAGVGFRDASLMIPRHTKDSYGTDVVTLVTGLAGAVQNQAQLTLLQDFTNLDEWTGFYRSSAADWQTPNEYLNLVRRYSDPKTVTLRLEAEGCDKYDDTTPGNSAGAFLRNGDLDVRALSASGWAVTNTAPGEWIEFDNVDFSAGTYDFSARYATSASSSSDKRVQLLIDGEHLTPIIASNTVNVDTFEIALLGTHTLAHGTHTIRVRFLDGLIDLDWLFIRKTDPVLSLQNGTNFVSAQEGGGGPIKADATGAAIFEQFTFDDLNGGSLVDGDQVQIQAYDGLYLRAAGSALSAGERAPGSAETFTVHAISAGDIAAGSTIALATSDGKHYVTVGSSQLVDVSGTSVGPAQTLTAGFY